MQLHEAPMLTALHTSANAVLCACNSSSELKEFCFIPYDIETGDDDEELEELRRQFVGRCSMISCR